MVWGQGLLFPSPRADARPMPETAKAVGGILRDLLAKAKAKTKRKACSLTTNPAQLSEDGIQGWKETDGHLGRFP